MVPKLIFTADSWPEEYREDANKLFNKPIMLCDNKDVVFWKTNTNCHINAFVGYENAKAKLTTNYGYADTEAAVLKYVQQFVDDPHDEYLLEIGLLSKDIEKYYKSGSYINSDGVDTEQDFYDIFEYGHEPETDYENAWVKIAVYLIEK